MYSYYVEYTAVLMGAFKIQSLLSGTLPETRNNRRIQFGFKLIHHKAFHLQHKVYKYKVVSTSFNDDIFGIEIITLQERLCMY
jgi:hypothetical protein